MCLGVPIARTGMMQYGTGETPLETGDDGIVEITRAPEEVFRPQTIASFEGKAVTIAHPREFVSSGNWTQLAKGVVQNVRRGTDDQADSLIADLLITDKVAISLVKNGLREVSCGYEAEYTQTGEGQGVQTNIIGNHVALVDEGRAGSQYAIKDHKGVTMDKKSVFEKLMAVVGITKDEAKKLVQDADMEKKDDKKEDKSEDAAKACMDDLLKAVKDLNSAISGMANPTEAAKDEDKKDDKKEDKSADADGGESDMETRMKKLEASVAALLEKMASKDEDMGGEVITDEDMEGDEDESEDEGYGEEEGGETGDTASRIEILAPGLKVQGKDAKAKALKACYDTAEGKTIIEQLNGGKAPAFDSKEKVDFLFTAASEVFKATRTKSFAKSKQVRDAELIAGTPEKEVVTAEKMNELNAKYYSQRRS